jgi:hypothetical protein
MEIKCKNVGVFINRAVLDGFLFAFANLQHLTKPTAAELNAMVKRPLLRLG